MSRLKRGDFHVHTTLSDCAHRDAVPETVLARAQEERLEALGVTDHIFGPQDLAKPLQLRARLPKRAGGVRVYVGCEAEMHGPEDPTITPEYAADRDFAVVAASHLHFLPEKRLDAMDASQVVDLIFTLTDGAIASGCADIIAHPFRVNGCRHSFTDLVGAVDRARLMATAHDAARAGIAIECNPRSLRGAPEAAGWLLTCFLEAGCKLSIGSDAHWPVDIGCNTDEFATEEELRALGLTDGRLWTIADRVTGRRDR